MYAYDIILLSKSAKGLQEKLDILNTVAGQIGLISNHCIIMFFYLI